MTDRLLAINDLLLECAAGQYQWDLIMGRQCWSGSDLLGEAGRWSARYLASRGRLLKRVNEALARRGWRAFLGYVLMGEPRRWHLRLVLVDADLNRYDQVTGNRLGIVELPEDSCAAPGFELRAVA